MDTTQFKAGTYKKQYEYDSFSPSFINLEWMVSDPALAALYSMAERKLGELNAAGRWMDDIDYFIKMHVAKEATTSSRIEGTQTTMVEAVSNSGDIEPERRDDWMEVNNYIKSMNKAIERMQKLPISSRLFREAHAILMSGVRGERKSPGEFRKSQNWLGASLKTAAYIPPLHTEIPDLIGDLEKFLNNHEIATQPLMRVAIAHYQFETIHPFLDGNGRLGRLLITLYLVSTKMLGKPTLYLSDFFARNRLEYYDRLTLARQKNDLNGWLKFFFAGVIETAENSIETLEKIVVLRQSIAAEKLPQLGKRLDKGKALLNLLYARPVVDRVAVEKMLGVSASTAGRIILDFLELGILRETTGFGRNRRYAFSEYIGIFEVGEPAR